MMNKSRTKANDLKRMDEQLKIHVDRVFSMQRGVVNHEEQDIKVLKRDEWELDPNRLTVKSLIGKGAFGTVYKGVYKGKEVAVKTLDLGDENRRARVKKVFTQEVSIWYKLHHPNIAKLIGATRKLREVKMTNENGEQGEVMNGYCIVVEYVAGGTLKSFLSKNKIKRLPLKTVIHLALDIARGLSFLHSKKIIHRDVKTENLLLDKGLKVKIIDFGVSRVEACPIEMTSKTGTMGYMAPEVLGGLPYDHKCDVYSFGICLWEIYCCSMPYPEQIPLERTSTSIYKDRRPEIPKSCPGALADLMKRCWDVNPKKRPEMQEVVFLLEAFNISKNRGRNALRGCLSLFRERAP